MIAIEIVKNGHQPDKEQAEKIVTACGQKGLLLLTSGVEGNILRTLMPLCIKDNELQEALDVIESVVKTL